MHVPRWWKQAALAAVIVGVFVLPTPPSVAPPCMGKRALLLTAHPDDECMFFAPTVLALAGAPKQQLFSLCLSTGDADGLGNIRALELEDSLGILGVHRNQSLLLDHLDFRDDMHIRWDAQAIARVVQPFVAQHDIDTILTFDDQGVSGHPNHASLVHGAKLVPNTRVAVLKTIPALSLKYSGPLAPGALKLGLGRLLASDFRPLRYILPFVTASLLPIPKSSVYIYIVGSVVPSLYRLYRTTPDFDGYYVASWRQYLQGVRAMQAHKSQMVWFRWLYISASQYMWYNQWQCID